MGSDPVNDVSGRSVWFGRMGRGGGKEQEAALYEMSQMRTYWESSMYTGNYTVCIYMR